MWWIDVFVVKLILREMNEIKVTPSWIMYARAIILSLCLIFLTKNDVVT